MPALVGARRAQILTRFLGSGGGVVLPVLPTPIMLDSFDGPIGSFSVGSAFGSASIVAPLVQGTGALACEGNGNTGVTPILTKLNAFTADLTTLDTIAIPINIRNYRGINGLALNFGRNNANFVGPADKPLAGQAQGKRWLTVHTSEIASLPTGEALTDLRIRLNGQNAPNNARITLDAIYGRANGRPTYVNGFDDGFRSTYDIAFPYMRSRGLVGTVYVPWSRIGPNPANRISNFLVVTELLEMQAAGWAICLDGTGDDTVMTAKADPAACVTELQAGRAWLAANGFFAEGGNHICYPNGYHQGDAGGVPVTPTQIAAATSDGSTTVTFGAATAVVQGAVYEGFNVPPGTRISSASGTVTTVTLTNPVPAQTRAAMTYDDSGAFFFGKLPAALAAAGFKTARTTAQDETYTRFGFGDQALVGSARTTSAQTLASLQPWMESAKLKGLTFEPYIHQINGVGGSINMLDTDFYATMDYQAADIAAGRAVSLTKPAWYARDSGAVAP